MTLHRAGTFFKRHVRHTDHTNNSNASAAERADTACIKSKRKTSSHSQLPPSSLRSSSRDSFVEPIPPKADATTKPAVAMEAETGEDGKQVVRGSLIQPLLSFDVKSSATQKKKKDKKKHNSASSGKKQSRSNRKRENRLLPKLFNLRKYHNAKDEDEASYDASASSPELSSSGEFKTPASVRDQLIASGQVVCRIKEEERNCRGSQTCDEEAKTDELMRDRSLVASDNNISSNTDTHEAKGDQEGDNRQQLHCKENVYDPAAPRKKTIRQIEKEWPRLSPEQRMERVITQNYNEVLYSISVVFETRRDYWSRMMPEQRMLIQELEQECWVLEARAEQIRERGWTTNEEMKEMQGYLWGLKCDVLVHFAPMWRWAEAARLIDSPDLWSSATEPSFVPTTLVLSPDASGKMVPSHRSDSRKGLEDSFSTVVLESTDGENDSDDFGSDSDFDAHTEESDDDSYPTASYDSWLDV